MNFSLPSRVGFCSSPGGGWKRRSFALFPSLSQKRLTLTKRYLETTTIEKLAIWVNTAVAAGNVSRWTHTRHALFTRIYVEVCNRRCYYVHTCIHRLHAWERLPVSRSMQRRTRREETKRRKCSSTADWTWQIREKLGKCDGGLLANRFRASNKKEEICAETRRRA